MKAKNIISVYMVIAIILSSCGSEDEGLGQGQGQSSDNDQWLIPVDEVFDGGPGKDGIPALVNPELISVAEATYLSDDDLVLGYKNEDDIRAYPHAILDWHEIINDKVNGVSIAATYCPLTGTGIGWGSVLDGEETTFGVSGLLYNSNLILYDRKTDSNWSQMRLDCVNGQLTGEEVKTYDLVETTWKTWKSMYPETKVVSNATGYNRNYDRYPYGDYRTSDQVIFPYSPKDDRLAVKERVHGVIIHKKSKGYRFKDFANGLVVIEDQFQNAPLVIAGSVEDNFIVSFHRTLADGTTLTFSANPDFSAGGHILVDNEGNTWDIFGKAQAGPRTGQQLATTASFIGYWFSWGAFYPCMEVYGTPPKKPPCIG